MPTNNILLFDQNKANMLNDSAYNTNQQRLNGVQSGIASSQLQNKFQYQVSLVAYAIASIMYNNGMDANDADAVSAFVSNMSNTLVQKVLDKASTQEAQAGTVDTKWMSPSLVKAAIDYFKQNAVTFGNTVTLSGDPTENLQAATKQYVDNNVSGLFQIVAWTGAGEASKTLSFNGTPQLVVIASKLYDSDSRTLGYRVFGVGIRGCVSMPMGYYYNQSRYWNCQTSWGSNTLTLSGSGDYSYVPTDNGCDFLAFAFLS